MATKKPYYAYKDGKKIRVPAVTTILRQLGWSTESLIYWANQAGLDGMTTDEARSVPLDVGTVTHARIEADLKGLPDVDLSGLTNEIREQSDRAFSAWLSWKSDNQFSLMESEHELISESLMFGGRLDIAMDRSSRCILDFKAAKGIYPDNIAQLAAYRYLWNEHYPDRAIERCAILRLSKTDGAHHYSAWPKETIDLGWRAFEHALDLYRIQKEISGRL